MMISVRAGRSSFTAFSVAVTAFALRRPLGEKGRRRVAGRRKVLVWSKRPWSAVDMGISGALPGGRLVAGITLTALGPLTVVGVCVPWRDAHVRSGGRERSQWQEHE